LMMGELSGLLPFANLCCHPRRVTLTDNLLRPAS
jgi:hypothetical protein